MPDHSYDDLTLDRFWDDLIDAGNAKATLIDPESAAAVRAVHALAQASPPAGARERVRQKLMPLTLPAPTHKKHFTHAARMSRVLPAPSPIKRGLPAPKVSPAMRHAAIAALFLLMIGGIVGSNRLLDQFRDDTPHGIPAGGFGVATPAATTVTESTLLEVNLPASNFPAVDRLYTSLEFWSVPPGATDIWDASYQGGAEPSVIYIIDGSYTVRPTGPVQLIRADGEPETAPAEVSISLEPGDAIAPSANTGFQFTNQGVTPVLLLTWSLVDPKLPTHILFRNWVSIRYAGHGQLIQGPIEQVTFRLSEVDLEPGASLIPPADLMLQLFLERDDTFTLIGEQADRTIINKGRQAARLYVATLHATGTRREAIKTVDQSEETLVELSFPPEAFGSPNPGNNQLSLDLQYVTIAANVTGIWDMEFRPDYQGQAIEYVLEGTVTVTSNEPVQVIRDGNDSEPETPPIGSEVVLGPGDALVHRFEHNSIWITGAHQARLVSASVVANSGSEHTRPDQWTVPAYTSKDYTGLAPKEQSMLRLRRVTMQPDTVTSIEPGDMKLLLIQADLPGFMGEGSDGSLTLMGASGPTIVFEFSVEPVTATSGSSAAGTREN